MTNEEERRRANNNTMTVREVYGILNERFRANDQRFEQQERALAKTEGSMDKRLEGMNEFRAALNDQLHTFLPRQEYIARHEILTVRIDELTQRLDKQLAEAAGSRKTITVFGSIALAIVAFLSAVLHYLK